ncbi:hypothetical protein [Hyphomicrobium sp.]|uniref:hypothetical protein n=1 Tax=Hyphomicrobium sp. TaxID=82 RepID=UPI0025BA67C7|nr:hypothetical protein [Hyphomicrobium sp.]
MLVETDQKPKPEEMEKPTGWKYGPRPGEEDGRGKEHHGKKDDDDGRGKEHHGKKDDDDDDDGRGKDHKDHDHKHDWCKNDDDGGPPNGWPGQHEVKPVDDGPYAGTGDYGAEAISSLMDDGGGLLDQLPLVGGLDLPLVGELPLDALPLDAVSDVLPA